MYRELRRIIYNYIADAHFFYNDEEYFQTSDYLPSTIMYKVDDWECCGKSNYINHAIDFNCEKSKKILHHVAKTRDGRLIYNTFSKYIDTNRRNGRFDNNNNDIIILLHKYVPRRDNYIKEMMLQLFKSKNLKLIQDAGIQIQYIRPYIR